MRDKVTWEEAAEIVMENLENPEEMKRLNDMWAEIAQTQTAVAMDCAKELGVSEEDMIAGVFLSGATVGYCLGLKDGGRRKCNIKWILLGYDVVRYRDLPEDTYFREAGKNEVWYNVGGMVVSCGNGNVRTTRFNNDTLVIELEIYEVREGVTYFKEVWRRG